MHYISLITQTDAYIHKETIIKHTTPYALGHFQLAHWVCKFINQLLELSPTLINSLLSYFVNFAKKYFWNFNYSQKNLKKKIAQKKAKKKKKKMVEPLSIAGATTFGIVVAAVVVVAN